MDVISLVSLIQSKKSGGGGNDFPVKEFFDGTCKELVVTGAETIRSYAFYQLSSVESILLPDATRISYGAFYTCSNLSTVHFREGLRVIENNAFMSCPKISELVIPSTVENIGFSAFGGCTSLVTVTFLGTPQMIGSEFTSTVLPTTVRTIYVPWREGEVPGFPWGATKLENIFYEYSKGE